MRPRHFIDPYRWYDEFARDSWRTGNEQNQQLAELYRRVRSTNNVDQVSAICDEGIKFARQIDQPFWELFFRISQYQNAPQNGLITDDLIQMSIEINQPKLEGCSHNVVVYRELLHAYSVTDPLGHVTDILEGCDYIEQSMVVDQSTYTELAEFRSRVYRAQCNWEKAHKHTTEYLNRALEMGRAYYIVLASLQLTELEYRLGMPHIAITSIQHAEKVARQEHQSGWLKTVLRWYLPLYISTNNQSGLKHIEDELKFLEKEQTFIQGIMAIMAYDEITGKIVELLTDYAVLVKKAHQFNERTLEIDLSIDYYAILKKSSRWKRWIHFGSLRLRHSIYMQVLIQLREAVPIWGWVLMPVLYGSMAVVGCYSDIFQRTVPKFRTRIKDLISQSSAKEIYESRLRRIDQGDYTQLS